MDSIIDREPDDDEAEEGAGGEDMDVDQGVGPSGSNGLTGPLGVDDEEEEEEESSDEEDLGEDIVKLRDHLEEEEEQLVVGSQRPRRRPQQQPIWKGPRHPTLDDGFFGIDKFNRDTELMEAKSRSRGRLGGDEDDSEEEEEDIDLFAPIDAGEDEEMEVDDDEEEDEEDEESDEEEGGIPGKQSMLNGAFKTEGMDGEYFVLFGLRSSLIPSIQVSCTTTSSVRHSSSQTLLHHKHPPVQHQRLHRQKRKGRVKQRLLYASTTKSA